MLNRRIIKGMRFILYSFKFFRKNIVLKEDSDFMCWKNKIANGYRNSQSRRKK